MLLLVVAVVVDGSSGLIALSFLTLVLLEGGKTWYVLQLSVYNNRSGQRIDIVAQVEVIVVVWTLKRITIQ